MMLLYKVNNILLLYLFIINILFCIIKHGQPELYTNTISCLHLLSYLLLGVVFILVFVIVMFPPKGLPNEYINKPSVQGSGSGRC